MIPPDADSRHDAQSRRDGLLRICRRAPHGFMYALLLILLSIPAMAQAEMLEWRLADSDLHNRTTAALQRYFSFVRGDSLRLRYIRNNAPRAPYRLRAQLGSNDSLGQLISVSIGQLTLFPASNIRVALGDDLYLELLRTHDRAAAERTVIDEDSFGHNDWRGDRLAIASLDRLDVRLNPALGIFAQIGAPESNLSWWSDGTARAGIATPSWECALLFPWGAGATPVGPFRARLLAPGFGAAAAARIGPLAGRVRFTAVGDPAFGATRITPDVFVHTLSAQATGTIYTRETLFGILRLDLGAGYEEYAQAAQGAENAEIIGYVRRISPVGTLTWTSAQENLQAKLGFADIAPQASFTTRFTEHLWLETRFSAPALIRDVKRFEHPYYLFITPRIKF